MRSRRPQRRGLALLMAIACVALLVLVFSTLMKLGFAGRGQVRSEERRLRAAWLAESGLERAWAKLSTDPEYRGESWELPAETLGGTDAAIVRIVVEPRGDHLQVTSRADYPHQSTSRARQTRIALFPVDPNTPQSGANP